MKNKIIAALLAIFIGTLGIHWFYLGKNSRGLTYLLITVLLCWTCIAPAIMAILTFIEGIMLLVRDDESFNAEYNQSPPPTAIEKA